MGSIWNYRFEGAGRPLIIAHRGASLVAQENTEAAFNAAIEAGADALEADIRLTGDGIPICFHDEILSRPEGNDLEIASASLQDLQAHRTDVMTFEKYTRYPQGLYLDLKETDEARCAGILSHGGIKPADNWIVSTAMSQVSKGLARRFPDLRQVALINHLGDMATLPSDGAGQWARLHEPNASPQTVGQLRRQGFRVVITCGGGVRPIGVIDERSLQELVELKPDALILGDPALASRVIRARCEPLGREA